MIKNQLESTCQGPWTMLVLMGGFNVVLQKRKNTSTVTEIINPSLCQRRDPIFEVHCSEPLEFVAVEKDANLQFLMQFEKLASVEYLLTPGKSADLGFWGLPHCTCCSC